MDQKLNDLTNKKSMQSEECSNPSPADSVISNETSTDTPTEDSAKAR